MDTNSKSKGRDGLVVKADISLAVFSTFLLSVLETLMAFRERRDTELDKEWLVTRGFAKML